MFSCNMEVISCLTDSVKVVCAVQGNDFEEPEAAAKAPELAPAPDAPARAENQRPRSRWRRLAVIRSKRGRPFACWGRVWPPGNDGCSLTSGGRGG